MEKIICDICGTTYPGASESCPICGCSNAMAAEILSADMDADDFLNDVDVLTEDSVSDQREKKIFDFDKVNGDDVPEDEEENNEDIADEEDVEDDDEDDDDDDYDDEEVEEEPRRRTGVVILLTVLIVVLLGAAAFIFLRYFLPNMSQEETVPTTMVQQTETVAPTTEPEIPCKQMVMTNAGVAELSAEGQQFLLHIKALPENTTDPIIFTSGDESVATVTEDGKITAVAEGETIIYISCGEHSIECPVIVKYVEETVPPTTEAIEETVPETTEEDTDEEETSEEEEADKSDVVLKLKRTDIQLGVYYQFRLELDCDLDPEDVTWTSEHPYIATVDAEGKVTAIKSGTTSITAKYGDQEVKCMVRCIWY